MDIEYTTAGLVNWDLDGEENWFFEERGRSDSTTASSRRRTASSASTCSADAGTTACLIRWIEERRTLDWVLEHLNEAAFDTEFVPPLRVRGA